MLIFLGTIIVLFLLVMMYACLRVSSEESRKEELRDRSKERDN